MAFAPAVKQELKRTAVKYCPGLLGRHWLRRGQCEPEAAWLRHLCDPSRITVDVGALWGQYTAMALAYSKMCYAFEPQPQQVAKMRDLFAKVRNRVVIEQVALSDRNGVAVLRVPNTDPAWATIEEGNPMRNFRDLAEINVPRRRLDGYSLREIGFIKIDVEGHEESVLLGARETIARNKPNLLIEIEERHNPGGLSRLPVLLKEWGYEGYFMKGEEICPLSDFSLRRHQSDRSLAGSGLYVNNFIFSCDLKVPAALRKGRGLNGR